MATAELLGYSMQPEHKHTKATPVQYIQMAVHSQAKWNAPCMACCYDQQVLRSPLVPRNLSGTLHTKHECTGQSPGIFQAVSVTLQLVLYLWE